MKKTLGVVSILLLFGLPVWPVNLNLSLSGGAMWPDSDPTVSGTFGKGFYINGNLGAIDENSGWEIRGNFGTYSVPSHHPSDVGTNTRLTLTPLKATLLYNMSSPHSFIQPFIGAGGGVYFYDVQDDPFGKLESGTKFGGHLLGGVKINLSSMMHVRVEYSKDFIPAFFFSNANNFNSAVLTVGAGFMFPIVGQPPARPLHPVSEPDQDNGLADQIHDLTEEIQLMKTKQSEIQAKIDAFYENTDFDENSPTFAKEFRKIQYLESKLKKLDEKIKEAEIRLSQLTQQWKKSRPVIVTPAENKVIIYETYPRPHFHRRYYRKPVYIYYRETDYIVPETVPAASPTVEEKEKFFEKKKERLKEMKNR